MRIAVLSDVHSNLVALEAVLAHAGAVDAVWHLGDIVGYGPDPDGVVARLAAVGAIGVRGNHDAAAVGGREIESFNREARQAMEWTRANITAQTKAWLSELPHRRAEDGFTLVHGSPLDPTWEYVTDERSARENIAALETPHGLHGHTHVPIAWLARADDPKARVLGEIAADGETRAFDGRRAFLNPGSVGQPRDGDPRASYLILDPGAGVATWHRVPYDIDAVASAMTAAGLPARLAERLSFGV
jgi:diadenosine tetraphosphatase ApaH/serine/threonine PP2A family protein phosphatase